MLYMGCGQSSETTSDPTTAPSEIELGEVEFQRSAGSGEPHLSAGPGGTALLSWLEEIDSETHALRLAVRTGGSWSDPRTIREGDSFFVNWADFPSAVQLESGMIVAHWLEWVADTPYAYHTMLSWSRDGGESWSDPIPAHRDDSPTEHGFVSIVPWDEGAAVVWLDGRAMGAPTTTSEAGGERERAGRGDMSLRFTTLDGDGRLGPELLLDGRTCECCQTSLVRTSEGLVAAYRDRSEDEIRNIAIVRGVGEEWTEPTHVADDGWRISGCPVNGPQLSASGLDLISAWFTGAGGEPRVNVAFSRDGGATFGSPIRIDEGAPVGRVDVELLEDGTGIVTWLEASGDEPGVMVRRASPDGTLGPAVLVTRTSGARASGFPRMTRLGRELLFAWTLPGEDGGIRVRAARLAGE